MQSHKVTNDKWLLFPVHIHHSRLESGSTEGSDCYPDTRASGNIPILGFTLSATCILTIWMILNNNAILFLMQECPDIEMFAQKCANKMQGYVKKKKKIFLTPSVHCQVTLNNGLTSSPLGFHLTEDCVNIQPQLVARSLYCITGAQRNDCSTLCNTAGIPPAKTLLLVTQSISRCQGKTAQLSR